eukprot:TRINITY_DN2478_c0_g5_i3.p2 TRINITY_DN2478_c0_g5~~TRINITY_DN2478_c0_g5_i3.p2  ORF type:complete len:317 (-),score=39.80 TRINITY_DN2478_c0_g5_i3:263-1213(-)
MLRYNMLIGCNYFRLKRTFNLYKSSGFTTQRQVARLPKTWCMKNEKPGYNNQQQQKQQKINDNIIIYGIGVSLTALVAGLLTVGRDSIEDLIYGDGLGSGILGSSGGDLAAAILWSLALFYATPYQLLLLFLGKIETERPSDWTLKKLGQISNLRVDDIDYSAPTWIRAINFSFFIVFGIITAVLFKYAVGDSIWSVSTGIGACFAAGVYDVGRPVRLSPQEAQVLEDQWQNFYKFAEDRLQAGGRCHESEIYKTFRKESPLYRDEINLSDDRLRSMIRQWAPWAQRTSTGYYKNLSIKAKIDPFTGEMTGTTIKQ